MDVILPCFSMLASDVPALQEHSHILVFAPHPDDDILSCGASIASLRQQGHHIQVVFVTDGSASSVSEKISARELAALRSAEARNALRVLGCSSDDLHFLAFCDSSAEAKVEQIAERLSEIIAQINPTRIYSPYGIDPHPDHRKVAQAVDLLVERNAVRCPVYEYPRFQAVTAISHLFNPAIWRKLRRLPSGHLNTLKRTALQEHRTQCENLTGEASWEVLPEHWLGMFFKRYELFIERSMAV